MKLFIAIVLAAVTATASGQVQFTARPERTSYQLADRVRVTIECKNTSDGPVWLYGDLSYLMMEGRDAAGRSVHGPVLSQHVPPPPRRTGEFVLLNVGHHLGTEYEFTMKELGISLPGEYTFVVRHHMPSPRGVGLKGRVVNHMLQARPFTLRVTR